MCDYTRSRSQFWLKRFDDNGSITLSANHRTQYMIDYSFPGLARLSPKGWRESQKYPDITNLWIPADRVDNEQLESLDNWANEVKQHIWLGTNANIASFFSGDELDYCVAADWNFDSTPSTRYRTPLGLAEYELKYQYPKGEIDNHAARQHFKTCLDAVLVSIRFFPVRLQDFVVTTIPAVKDKQNKISWLLAQNVAQIIGVPFIGLDLAYDKPQMKGLPLNEKIRIWREIYAERDRVLMPYGIQNTNVLIIDDLYQSGTSIWCLAETLKLQCRAKTVIGATVVKSLRDGDNT